MSIPSTNGSGPQAADATVRGRGFTPEQTNILMAYWSRGMRSSGTEETKAMVDEAAEKTNLSRKQVQNWIGTRNEKQKKEAGFGRKRSKPFCVSSIGKPPATDVQLAHRAFRREYLKENDQSTKDKRREVMKEVNEKWSLVKQDEDDLKHYKEVSQQASSTEAEPLAQVKAITKEISKLVSINMYEICA
ncbi:uncharacterized protein [Amphiura filiformis]|uniref:uncharacterized protein n=1 Tax=Amphiura filiformis TaxID=82378 RepID=UPI003B2138FE